MDCQRTLLIFLLLASATVAHAANSKAGVPKNLSDLEIAGASKEPRQFIGSSKLSWCHGSVPPSVDLASVGLTPDKLKSGVSCVATDFNGDGFLDFVLFGKASNPFDRMLLAVFYKGKDVLRTQVLPHVANLEVFEPSNPARKNYPDANPKLPGLIRPGTGDRGWVFFLDEKTGLFKETEWVEPPGYD